MNIKVTERLIRLRKEKGLSQEGLAHKLGVSRQAISKWERGEVYPDTENLLCLSQLYNISLDELLRIDDIPNENNASRPKENQIDDRQINYSSKTLYKQSTVYLMMSIVMIVMSVFTLIRPFFALFGDIENGKYRGTRGYNIFFYLDTMKSFGAISAAILCALMPICAIISIIFGVYLLRKENNFTKRKLNIMNTTMISQLIFSILYVILGIMIYYQHEEAQNHISIFIPLFLSAIIFATYYLIPYILKRNNQIIN